MRRTRGNDQLVGGRGIVGAMMLARLLILLALILSPSAALAWKHGGGAVAPAAPQPFGALPIGAGGFVRDIQIAADGTKIVRTDTFGCYVWDTTLSPTQWRQVITASGMPASQSIVLNNDGCYEFVFAPSNTSHMYVYYYGNVFSSTDKGKTWHATGFPTTAAGANMGTASFGHYMAVDPANENRIYVGTPGSGLYLSTNGGTSFSLVSGVPAGGTGPGSFGQNGGNIVAFSPTSSVVGGVTQHIFAGSFGNGLYESTNGGTSWTLTPSSPTALTHMAFSSTGVLYAVNWEFDANLWRYSGGAWSTLATSISNPSAQLQAVAVDPANASRIAAVNTGGQVSTSTDAGASWSDFGPLFYATSNDIPWIAWSRNVGQGIPSLSSPTGHVHGLDIGNVAFDPTQTNVLYASDGLGVWYGNPPNTTGAELLWNTQSRGIEQLVGNMVLSPPGGAPVTGSWDRPFFYPGLLKPFVYPAVYNPYAVTQQFADISAGWSLDYQSTNPATIVGLATAEPGGVNASSYSLDGGQTWNGFVNPPPPETIGNVGGSIAIDSAGNIVIFPCQNGSPYRSTMPGATWTQISILGNNWCFAYYLSRHIVTADKQLPTTFYAFNTNSGTWKSTDGGVTWAVVSSDLLGVFTGFNAVLRAVPSTAGDLFFTAGRAGSHGDAQPYTQYFYHSINGGTTWTQVPNVLEAVTFGFGAPAIGHTNSSLWMVGWVNQGGCGYAYGIWESVDDAASFIPVMVPPQGSCAGGGTFQWPFNSLDLIYMIDGDMNSYGRFFVSFSGSGFGMAVTPDAAIKPIVAFEAANTSVAGQATISWQTDTTGATNRIDYGLTSSYGSTQSAPSGSPTSATLTGLANYQLYHYRACSGVSCSFDLTFTTKNAIPPNAPTGLTATVVDDTRINLSWTASTGDPQGVAGYYIYLNGASSPSVTTTGTGTTYAYSNLQPSTAYTFTVAAYDATGNVSLKSSSASATTPAPGVTWNITANPTPIAISATTTDFGSQSIGTANANRLVLVCAEAFQAGSVTGVTIGGVSATQLVDSHGTAGGPVAFDIGLYQAAVATGTTADIQVSTSTAGPGNGGIQVGSLITTTPTRASTALAAPFPGSPNAQSRFVTTSPLNVPASGIGVFCGFSNDVLNSGTPWFNGTPDIYGASTSGFTLLNVMGHIYSSGSQVLSVNADVSIGAWNYGMVAASWSP